RKNAAHGVSRGSLTEGGFSPEGRKRFWVAQPFQRCDESLGVSEGFSPLRKTDPRDAAEPMTQLASTDPRAASLGWSRLPRDYAIPASPPSLAEAREYCRRLARTHY